MCKVVNKHNDEYDIDITRPSKWSNPYSHKEGTRVHFKVDTRQEAIDAFENHLVSNPYLMMDLHSLKYKRIACVCKPKSCHGDVLKKYVDRLEVIDKRKDFLD